MTNLINKITKLAMIPIIAGSLNAKINAQDVRISEISSEVQITDTIPESELKNDSIYQLSCPKNNFNIRKGSSIIFCEYLKNKKIVRDTLYNNEKLNYETKKNILSLGEKVNYFKLILYDNFNKENEIEIVYEDINGNLWGDIERNIAFLNKWKAKR